MDDAERRADFTAYVAARGQALARLAYLLTGDRNESEDLLQNALAKVYRHWDRVSAVELPDAYVRRILVNERNSGWRRMLRRRETPSSHVLEVIEPPGALATDPSVGMDLWRRPPRSSSARSAPSRATPAAR